MAAPYQALHKCARARAALRPPAAPAPAAPALGRQSCAAAPPPHSEGGKGVKGDVSIRWHHRMQLYPCHMCSHSTVLPGLLSAQPCLSSLPTRLQGRQAGLLRCAPPLQLCQPRLACLCRLLGIVGLQEIKSAREGGSAGHRASRAALQMRPKWWASGCCACPPCAQFMATAQCGTFQGPPEPAGRPAAWQPQAQRHAQHPQRAQRRPAGGRRPTAPRTAGQ